MANLMKFNSDEYNLIEIDPITGENNVEYFWDEDSYRRDYDFINKNGIDVIMKDAIYTRIEGYTQRWNGKTNSRVFINTTNFDTLFKKYLSKDINEIELEVDLDKGYYSYTGYHHDGSNSYTLYPVSSETDLESLKQWIIDLDEESDYKEINEISIEDETNKDNILNYIGEYLCE